MAARLPRSIARRAGPAAGPGLGYAILRALGAHERLGPVALDVVAKWSAEYGAAHGGVTPDTINLAGQAFEDRVGQTWGAHRAAPNAACYPGGNAGRPSCADVYREVWVEQKWPDLCRALGARYGPGAGQGRSSPQGSLRARPGQPLNSPSTSGLNAPPPSLASAPRA